LNPKNFGGSTHYSVISCGESRLLVLWCAGDRCDIMGNNKDRDKSMRPGAEDQE
jgi:hypothetical protein